MSAERSFVVIDRRAAADAFQELLDVIAEIDNDTPGDIARWSMSDAAFDLGSKLGITTALGTVTRVDGGVS